MQIQWQSSIEFVYRNFINSKSEVYQCGRADDIMDDDGNYPCGHRLWIYFKKRKYCQAFGDQRPGIFFAVYYSERPVVLGECVQHYESSDYCCSSGRDF